MNTEKRELPPNFRSLVVDFTNDLTRVFPENDIHWRRWGDPDITDEELMKKCCGNIYNLCYLQLLVTLKIRAHLVIQ